MKRLAIAVVVLMLGILPAAAESASTQPIRGPELYAMALEMIEWIAQRTEYTSNGVPRIVFVDNFVAAIAEYELKREGAVDDDYKFTGSYNSLTKTVYLRDDWGGHTPKNLDTLVHELVHYAQDEGGKKFECDEDKELEAHILSMIFLTDSFGDQMPHIVSKLRAARGNQITCTPPSMLTAAD